MAPYGNDSALARSPDTAVESGPPRQVVNTRFGTLEIAPEHIVAMPKGPFGFADHTRFAIVDVPNRPDTQFRILQSLEDQQVSFIVLPLAMHNDWIAEADVQAACEAYRFDPGRSGLLLIATLRRNADGAVETTVNLKAPIVVDTAHQIARQVVFTGDGYQIRHRLS